MIHPQNVSSASIVKLSIRIMASKRFFSVLCLCAYFSLCSARPVISRHGFMKKRERALAYERAVSLGGDIVLTPTEQVVNEMILAEKKKYFEEARVGNISFLPSMHFLQTQPLIANTSIYQFLQKMPKGGVLHIHDSATVSLDWLVGNVTYRENLYICRPANSRPRFKFAVPAPSSTDECQWQLLRDLRESVPDVEEFDQTLKKNLSLLWENLDLTSMSQNQLWTEFLASFATIDGLVYHSSVFGDYMYQALTEFHRDNVQYMEIRILLQKTYNLDGSLNDVGYLLETYQNVSEEFKKNNPTSSGAKVIVTDIRLFDKTEIASTIGKVQEFRKKYPDFIAGFDLVAQEDLGNPLLFYLDELMAPHENNRKGLPYYFHAGETNWQGTAVDRNLIDAVLMGTRRIGHGFAIPKHPWVMEKIKTRQIAIEVNPISNQVLGLVADLRNHPAVSLIAQNYPVVISCDDPPTWGATGLSYDFYAAFMGMTGADTGLHFLKQVAKNSLTYSAMTNDERKAAMQIWTDKWEAFIDEMAGNVT